MTRRRSCSTRSCATARCERRASTAIGRRVRTATTSSSRTASISISSGNSPPTATRGRTAASPAAAVGGIYLANPSARYFSVGRLGRDQVEDYAARKGTTVEEAERWLTPNLGYETRSPAGAL